MFYSENTRVVCADRVSVGISFDANLKWNIPICVERYRAEQKYMPFLGPLPSALSGKKSEAQEHRQMMQRYVLDFFPAKRAW